MIQATQTKSELVIEPTRTQNSGEVVEQTYADPQNPDRVLAIVRQPKNSQVGVLLHAGKAGFTALILTHTLMAYVTPGGRVRLGDTSVELPMHEDMVTVGQTEDLPARLPGRPIQPQNGQTYTKTAFFLLGGDATRLRPYTAVFPKPAAPVGGRMSAIENTAEIIAAHNIENILGNVNFSNPNPQSIVDILAGTPQGRNGHLVVIHEPEASGSAGGLRKILEWLDNPASQPAIELPDDIVQDIQQNPLPILAGDSMWDQRFNLSEALAAHVSSGADITVICTEAVPEAIINTYGMVQTDQPLGPSQYESGWITALVEKPDQLNEVSSTLISCGNYILSPRVYPAVMAIYRALPPEQQAKFDFANHIFKSLLKQPEYQSQYTLRAHKIPPDVPWIDLGNLRELYQANIDVFTGKYILSSPVDIDGHFDQASGVVFLNDAKAKAGDAEFYGPVIVDERPPHVESLNQIEELSRTG